MFGALLDMLRTFFKAKKRQVFEETQELSGSLDVVWKGGKCGVYDNSSETLVLAVIYTEISRQYFPCCRVVKDTGEIGLFDILSRQVVWSP